MNQSILVEAGLTRTQALVYVVLVEHSPASPPFIAEKIGESRTNTYKVLEQLETIGLAKRDETGKKIVYWAHNPSVLLQKIKEEERQYELRTKKIEASLPILVDAYMKHRVQPAVRYYEGKAGIEQIYADTLKEGKPISLIRSVHDEPYMSEDFLVTYKKKRAKIGIQTRALSPKNERSVKASEQDKAFLIDRVWLQPQDYSAAVEVDIYADKFALISFGEEAMGLIIESPQIAEAMRQIFQLAKRGATVHQHD
jgi:sugar-specific transcriptional regulator TrmB